MKIKKGFILREVSGNYIVVAVGEGVKTFNGMIQLNQTSAFLWKMLEKGAEQKDLVEGMLREYDVTREIAEKDVNDFIESLREANLI